MLKQILRDMYVAPEILAGLDETQKQTLFCKMREEQIRRWRVWEQQDNQQTNEINKPITNQIKTINQRQKVSFMTGEDGEPWVWVMGEHANDKTIEQILAEEAQQRARQLAELETKELRKSVEAGFTEIIEYEPDNKKKLNNEDVVNEDDRVILRSAPQIDELEIYCSVDELRERITNNAKISQPIINTKPPQLNSFKSNKQSLYSTRTNTNDLNRDVLQEISLNRPTQKVATRIAQWEQRLIGERTSEILLRIQMKQQETAKEAEEAAIKQEDYWREQERKAKQAETQIREIARRAREEHRRSTLIANDPQPCDIASEKPTSSSPTSSGSISPPSSLDPSVPRPPNQEAVVRWYREDEWNKGAGLDNDGRPAKWFHGLLTRAEAERILMPELLGTFLVRVSEKIWGYAISYKDTDRCKHYLVDASSGNYQFLGANQLSHQTLNDIINYHRNVPITAAGKELLLKACPLQQDNQPDILAGLA